MPNIWTHLIFGQKVMELIGEKQLISAPEHLRMFNMGCQGPDFLFYHHFLPWQKDKTMNKLGSEMHNRQCGPVMMHLLDSVSSRSLPPATADPALVYALGFVLHHILDRNMHPYVFSRSGFRKWDHQRFEVMMDTLIVRKLLGLETWKTQVWREINNNGILPETIIDAFEQATAIYYPELAPRVRRDYWQGAIRDMIRAQRLFYDPRGIRRVLTFGQIEPLVYKRNMPALDILNESRSPWLDPVEGKKKNNESVWDLWDEAIEDGISVIAAILEWFREQHRQGGKPLPSDDAATRVHVLREAAAGLIGSRSYETGLSCESGAEIRHADPIWT
ncbi:zinc dependent phospholipase C family protein [Paenibacillus oenotherae]|uniref:Zinc dependent phospholipase C family protein n=1 Tax=Paenibacillus oenotherae TaxID=1435645 RepID=A0ABS7D3I1_9BACL|nr:zinc dependent phospholipase C family protein [Paenibacillus oenotherae]MBW7474482.1 zinc dependent phospholipase C family protein [Paenibacillus oenotherae]